MTSLLTFPCCLSPSPSPSLSLSSRSCFFFSFSLYKSRIKTVSSYRINHSLVSSFSVDGELIERVSEAKDAVVALEIIATEGKGGGGVVSVEDCCSIISAALGRGNVDLAMSVLAAMRGSFEAGASSGEMTSLVQRWRWSRPDVDAYTLLVLGLAASLRVSDALKMIGAVSRVGVSPGEEVPFGKIVRCPTCLIAVAVAQPQHGIQA